MIYLMNDFGVSFGFFYKGLNWILLWVLWTWIWAFKWFQLYKSYNLSSNEALEVLKENKDNPEIVKSYYFYHKFDI